MSSSAGIDAYDAPLPRELSREERQREALNKARERDRKQYALYLAARKHRLSRLQEAHPEVGRYLNALGRIQKDAECPRKNDCDFDLAELACRCGIDALSSERDRWFVYELTSEWLERIGGKRFNLVIDESEDLFSDPFANTAMGELKAALNIR